MAKIANIFHLTSLYGQILNLSSLILLSNLHAESMLITDKSLSYKANRRQRAERQLGTGQNKERFYMHGKYILQNKK